MVRDGEIALVAGILRLGVIGMLPDQIGLDPIGRLEVLEEFQVDQGLLQTLILLLMFLHFSVMQF